MNITFLGTGTSQGVPVIACHCPVCRSADPRDQRLRSSIMIEHNQQRLIIDCGPDFRQQMLREQVESIRAILITHNHRDHIAGLDDVRAFNYILKKPAQVFTTPEVAEAIVREYAYAFSGTRYPGVPEIELQTFTNSPFRIDNTDILPIRAIHYGDDQFVYGFRIGSFTYLTDVFRIPEEEKEKVKGSSVIVLNALRKKKHYSHLCLSEALELLEEWKPDHAYLTHISHQMGCYNEVAPELPPYVTLAYDTLSFTV